MHPALLRLRPHLRPAGQADSAAALCGRPGRQGRLCNAYWNLLSMRERHGLRNTPCQHGGHTDATVTTKHPSSLTVHNHSNPQRQHGYHSKASSAPDVVQHVHRLPCLQPRRPAAQCEAVGPLQASTEFVMVPQGTLELLRQMYGHTQQCILPATRDGWVGPRCPPRRSAPAASPAA